MRWLLAVLSSARHRLWGPDVVAAPVATGVPRWPHMPVHRVGGVDGHVPAPSSLPLHVPALLLYLALGVLLVCTAAESALRIDPAAWSRGGDLSPRIDLSPADDVHGTATALSLAVRGGHT